MMTTSCRNENDVKVTPCKILLKYRAILRRLALLRKTNYVKNLLCLPYKSPKVVYKHQSGNLLALLPIDLSSMMPPEVVYLLENVAIFAYQALRSQNAYDITAAAMVFYKLQSQCHVYPFSKGLLAQLQRYITSLFDDSDIPLNLQGLFEEVTITEMLHSAKDKLDLWPKLVKTELWHKVHKVMMFMTASALYTSRCEKQVDAKFIAKVDKEIYNNETMFQIDMMHTILDTLLFLTEKGYQIFYSGEISTIFHSGKSYEVWLVKSNEMIAKSKYLCNPVPHGIDIHTFQRDLQFLLDQGVDILKMSCDIPKMTITSIRSTVMRLQEVKASFINSGSANATRRAPLVVVLEGDVGGAKTTVADLMHIHFAAIRNKDVSFDSRFIMDALAKHMDGFKSYKWSLIIDDLGSENPATTVGIPESFKNVIGIFNNAPKMANMAAIEDKGKCPISCELAIVTTNSPNLHLHHYFATPAAAARRMKYHIVVAPKDEYKDANGIMDSTKLPDPIEGAYPDWWNFTLKEVKLLPTSTADRSNPYNKPFELREVCKFTNIADFILWYNKLIFDHNTVQDKIFHNLNTMLTTKLCDNCQVPALQCTCGNRKALRPSFSSKCSRCNEMKLSCTCLSRELMSIDNKQTCVHCKLPEDYCICDGYEQQALMESVCFYSFKTLIFVLYFVMLDFVFANFWNICVHCIDLLFYRAGQMFVFLYKQKAEQAFIYLQKTFSVRSILKHTWESLCDFDYLEAIKVAGQYVYESFKMPYVLVALVSILTTFIAAYLVWCNVKSMYDHQGHLDTGTRPTGNEKENVWFNPDYEVSNFDVGRLTKSWKGFTNEQIEAQIVKNTINCAFYFRNNGDLVREISSALCVGGQLYVTTSHSIPKIEEIPVDIVCGSSFALGNVTRHVLREDDIMRIGDLAFFHLYKVSPRADITGLFMGSAVKSFVGDAVMIGKNRSGSVIKKSIKAIKYRNVLLETGEYTMALDGFATPATVDGDCGSAYVLQTGQGPVIGGIHSAGYGNKAACAIIDMDELSKYMDFTKLFHAGKPTFKSQSSEKILSDLHVKSPVRFIKEGNARVFGSFVGFRAHLKSNVQDTLIRSSLERDGYKTDLVVPDMKSWQPIRANLLKLVSDTPPVDLNVLECATAGLINDWNQIDPKELNLLTVYDDLTITNGAPGVRFIDSINRRTSAGFPWNKSKKYFMDTIEVPGYDNCKKFTPEILERAEGIIVKYLNHERACPVFSGSLKDKAISEAKNAEHKIRMFMGAPIDFTYVMRKYLLSFVRVMQRNKFFFESAPGIEAQSAEWDSLYNYLTHFGEDNCVFGDFKAFDTSMPPEFLIAAFEVIISFHKLAKCSDDHITIITGIMYDIVYAYADVKGDLIELIGKNPSGHALTVTINSIVNCLYMRYAYCMHNPIELSCFDFKDNVHLITYGDDNGMNVNSKCDWFNHKSISEALALINVTYTMADKISESVPYIHISDSSFLKRKFRFEHEVGRYVCPLDEDSIIGSLMIGERSKFVSEKYRICSVILAANGEWFWHGRVYFDEWHEYLLTIIAEYELEEYMPCHLPDWDELINRYLVSSEAYFENQDIEKYSKQSKQEVILDEEKLKQFNAFFDRIQKETTVQINDELDYLRGCRVTSGCIFVLASFLCMFIYVEMYNVDTTGADMFGILAHEQQMKEKIPLAMHFAYMATTLWLNEPLAYLLCFYITIFHFMSFYLFFTPVALYVLYRYC
jgi:hypothetical protein